MYGLFHWEFIVVPAYQTGPLLLGGGVVAILEVYIQNTEFIDFIGQAVVIQSYQHNIIKCILAFRDINVQTISLGIHHDALDIYLSQ